jgi:transcriptional regulator with XRE-family HTH domain
MDGRVTPVRAGALVAAASWLPVAAGRETGRDLGELLRGYRHVAGVTQQQVADMLGYDRTYISMIERGRRHVNDRGTLAHIARTLAIPPHMLGIAGPDDASYKAMLAFGTSVVRLAELARYGGRAADAVGELWPLITRLEARVAEGRADPDVMRLLVQARVSFGVALGDLLPEERLATAARWTGSAMRVAWNLGDRELLASVLRRHGNELRKAGYAGASVVRLRQSLAVDARADRAGSGLVLLARAAAIAGQADLFDATSAQCVRLLDQGGDHEVLFNAFTVREVRLRGLLSTGRAREAVALAESSTADEQPPAPQWRVIEQITTADVLASGGEARTAAQILTGTVREAEVLRLPHQMQRIIRLAQQPAICSADQHLSDPAKQDTVTDTGRSAVFLVHDVVDFAELRQHDLSYVEEQQIKMGRYAAGGDMRAIIAVRLSKKQGDGRQWHRTGGSGRPVPRVCRS